MVEPLLKNKPLLKSQEGFFRLQKMYDQYFVGKILFRDIGLIKCVVRTHFDVYLSDSVRLVEILLYLTPNIRVCPHPARTISNQLGKCRWILGHI